MRRIQAKITFEHLENKTYPVVERWRWVWIWMGEPSQADPSEIPIFSGMIIPIDSHRWPFRNQMHYQLLVDNLLDLSHVFVHRSTIGVMVGEISPETGR